MAKSREEKKKQKRKKKKKQAGRSGHAAMEHGWFHLEEANIFITSGHTKKAVNAVKKAARFLPHEEEVIQAMGAIAEHVKDDAMEVDAMNAMERIGKISDTMKVNKVFKLLNLNRYKQCRQEAEKLLKKFTDLKIDNKRKVKKNIEEIAEYCLVKVMEQEQEKSRKAEQVSQKIQEKKSKAANKTPPPVDDGNRAEQEKEKIVDDPGNQTPALHTQAVPVVCDVDEAPFFEALSDPVPSTPEAYELALSSHRIRFAESFESLVCLTSLTQVRSFWYQEETAKKVLKQFRGRALLSDEVGLGKTIEALIILVEYIKRGMVTTGVILTPTPLVSQWKEELKLKFNMDVPSTDDPEFQSGSRTFWDNPLVVASINHAKSKKNFDLVTGREYDMIIVDEAHHLKNRSTLNWKLVNSLKKRFILLLTATPVENNLMELYNLITLLKPGQLATAKAFREKFMTRGDPTDPRNQALLKELLNQVMIRNTRALAGIHIPPRFAETIRIEPMEADKVFYQRLEELILSLNEKKQGRAKTIVKNLLAQAGSSPKAVEMSLNNMLAKKQTLGEHEEEIRAVKNLCRTTVDTPKNKALLKVIKATREKIIVFVKYRGTVDHLAEFLEWNSISFSIFHGSMDNHQKDLAVEDFREKNQVLVTTEIGGEGRNLQFCSRMVNYDLPWNPMKIEQRIGRIHRIGQENQVQIFNFCATGSIEDYILDVLDRKINMFEMVIGEIDMVLGRVRGEKEFGDMVYDIWVNAESEQERKQSFSSLGTKLKRAKTGYHKTRELDDKLFGDNYEL